MLGTGLAATVVAAIGGLVWTPETFKTTWAATVVATATLLVWTCVTCGTQQVDALIAPDGPARAAESRGEVADLGVLVVLAGCVVAQLVHPPHRHRRPVLRQPLGVGRRARQRRAARHDVRPGGLQLARTAGGSPSPRSRRCCGVLAHLTGLHAGTMTYLVATPVGTRAGGVGAVAAVPVAGRRSRRCLVLARRGRFPRCSPATRCSATSGSSRMWQGKVMAVTILMPLIWAWLTEAADAERAGDPSAAGASSVLLLAARRRLLRPHPDRRRVGTGHVRRRPGRRPARPLAGARRSVGCSWSSVPLASGLAVVFFSSGVGGAAPVALSAQASFVRILGSDRPHGRARSALRSAWPPVARAPRRRLPPSRAPRRWSAALVFAPGVLTLINAVTGSGPILWRMLYVAPVPVLVGLLACVRLGPVRAAVRGAAPARRRPAISAAHAAARLGVALVLLSPGSPSAPARSGPPPGTAAP